MKYLDIDDSFYTSFAANDTAGSGADGASAVFDVREYGAAASAAPVMSGNATLLTHANYPAGAYEISVAVTVANGFADNKSYAVYCTLAVDGQNPTGFVGEFTTYPVLAVLANNRAHGGPPGSSTATLGLKQAVIVNSADYAMKIESSGNDGYGLWVVGNGDGAAVRFNGGAGGSGPGIQVVGGSGDGFGADIRGGGTDGVGMQIRGQGVGDALDIISESNDAVYITAITSGNGINIDSTGAGHDINLGGSGDIWDGVNARLVSTITADVLAAALARFFDTDSGKVFADAVAGSVVKETVLGAAAGSSSMTRSTGALLGTSEAVGVAIANGWSSTGAETDLLGDDTSSGIVNLYLSFGASDAAGFVEVGLRYVRVTGQAYQSDDLIIRVNGGRAGLVFLGRFPVTRKVQVRVVNRLSSGNLTNVSVLYELEKST